MDNALVYLIQRFCIQIGQFFIHWYGNGTRNFLKFFYDIVSGLDQIFAVRLMALHITEPLYGDYSVIGRLIGPIFRILRMSIGALLYLVVAVAVGALYLVWIAIPVVIFAITLYGY